MEIWRSGLDIKLWNSQIACDSRDFSLCILFAGYTCLLFIHKSTACLKLSAEPSGGMQMNVRLQNPVEAAFGVNISTSSVERSVLSEMVHKQDYKQTALCLNHFCSHSLAKVQQ